ncbi:hypothetical protein BJ742DRAFT_49846 [Cladochytrium replicatum]|nr:hypothetical protein BJ742DRAFT_49846 [Cladochytrium replicatum]
MVEVFKVSRGAFLNTIVSYRPTKPPQVSDLDEPSSNNARSGGSTQLSLRERQIIAKICMYCLACIIQVNHPYIPHYKTTLNVLRIIEHSICQAFHVSTINFKNTRKSFSFRLSCRFVFVRRSAICPLRHGRRFHQPWRRYQRNRADSQRGNWQNRCFEQRGYNRYPRPLRRRKQ